MNPPRGSQTQPAAAAAPAAEQVLVDATAVVALIDRRSPDHSRARQTIQRLRNADRQVVLSEVGLVNTYRQLHGTVGGALARQWLDGNCWPVVAVQPPDIDWACREMAARGLDEPQLLVQFIHTALFRRRGMNAIFTFDPEYERRGVQTL